MSKEFKGEAPPTVFVDEGLTSSVFDDDDKELEALGYVPSFKREFSNLATVCYL